MLRAFQMRRVPLTSVSENVEFVYDPDIGLFQKTTVKVYERVNDRGTKKSKKGTSPAPLPPTRELTDTARWRSSALADH